MATEMVTGVSMGMSMNMSTEIGNPEFYQELVRLLPEKQIFCKEPMSRHTTFQVGGPADYYLTPEPGKIADILQLCRENGQPVTVVGNGSNLLVGDGGIRGVVLALGRPAAQIQVKENRIAAGAGALLSQVAHAAYEEGLGGFEFAAGIPGSVGGAVVMNAGAYGGEIKDVLVQAKLLAQDGTIFEADGERLQLSYRHSCIPKEQWIVLEAVLELFPKPKEQIKAEMEELKKRRVEKQPLSWPSAGSTFKRPEGYFAGKLIMDAGLSGYSVGGAQISEKHCGFVVNKGNATAADIMELIRQVQQQVYGQFGVMLEPEVKCIGEFGH